MPTPTFVQYKTQDTTSPAPVFDGTTVTGNTFVVVAGVNTTGTFGTPTDTFSNTFILRKGPTSDAGGRVQQVIWDCIGGIGGASHTISLTTSTTTSMIVFELSSCGYLDKVDQQGQGQAGTASSPSITTTVATELLLGVGSTNTGDNGFSAYDPASAGYTGIVIGSQVAEFLNVTSTGSYTATATLGTGTYGVMSIIAYAVSAPAGGGGGSGLIADQILVY